MLLANSLTLPTRVVLLPRPGPGHWQRSSTPLDVTSRERSLPPLAGDLQHFGADFEATSRMRLRVGQGRVVSWPIRYFASHKAGQCALGSDGPTTCDESPCHFLPQSVSAVHAHSFADGLVR